MVFTNSERGGKLDDKNVFGDVDETLICELLQNNDQNGNDDDDDKSNEYETHHPYETSFSEYYWGHLIGLYWV